MGFNILIAKIDNDNLWMQDAKKVRELERAVDKNWEARYCRKKKEKKIRKLESGRWNWEAKRCKKKKEQ